MVSGEPSWLIRSGYHVFEVLSRLNLDRWGWQTVGIARWRGAQPGLDRRAATDRTLAAAGDIVSVKR
jgi:hypothetical protein